MSKSEFNSYEFFKENYFFEIDRKNQLGRALNIPFGLLVILGSSLLVIVKNISIPFILWEIIPVIFGFISMVFTIYFLIKSYYNYPYGFIASSEELKKYYDELVDFEKIDADDAFLEFVTAEYSKYADKNAINNDKKSSYIHKANGSLIFLLVFVILSGLPYILKSINKTSKIQDINITNINKIHDILNDAIAIKIKLSHDIKENTINIEKVEKMLNNKFTDFRNNEEEKLPNMPTPPPGRIVTESEE